MARPRKSTRQEMIDQFSDFHVDDQSSVLEIMCEIHRQDRRRATRGKDEDSLERKAESPSLLEGQ